MNLARRKQALAEPFRGLFLPTPSRTLGLAVNRTPFASLAASAHHSALSDCSFLLPLRLCVSAVNQKSFAHRAAPAHCILPLRPGSTAVNQESFASPRCVSPPSALSAILALSNCSFLLPLRLCVSAVNQKSFAHRAAPAHSILPLHPGSTAVNQESFASPAASAHPSALSAISALSNCSFLLPLRLCVSAVNQKSFAHRAAPAHCILPLHPGSTAVNQESFASPAASAHPSALSAISALSNCSFLLPLRLCVSAVNQESFAHRAAPAHPSALSAISALSNCSFLLPLRLCVSAVNQESFAHRAAPAHCILPLHPGNTAVNQESFAGPAASAHPSAISAISALSNCSFLRPSATLRLRGESRVFRAPRCASSLHTSSAPRQHPGESRIFREPRRVSAPLSALHHLSALELFLPTSPAPLHLRSEPSLFAHQTVSHSYSVFLCVSVVNNK